MKTIWHLVRKDLRRLRVPVLLLSLLGVAKNIFYASVDGVFGRPDLEWLNRLMNGSEMLLRFFAEPVATYFLVGWLIFEDSPVEKDAHWITRPVSGRQLFTAKVAAAALLFVLLPLALQLPWWVADGLGPREIWWSALQLAGMAAVLMALGLTCASLTDGFPRYVMWSVIGVGAFSAVQLLVTPKNSVSAGVTLSRLMVCCVGGSAIALAGALHQFTTRRLRKSVALVGAGILAAGVLGAVWRWNLTNPYGHRLAPEGPEAHGLRVTMTGPAHYRRHGSSHLAEVPLQLSGIPAAGIVVDIRMTGEWSFQGAKAWSSHTKLGGEATMKDALQRLLEPLPAAETKSALLLALPFSPALAQRAAREPVAFHAGVSLDLFRVQVMAELPLRSGVGAGGAGWLTVSDVGSQPITDRRAKQAVGGGPAQFGVSLALTARTVDSFLANAMLPTFSRYYVLANRRTGEIFLMDDVRSGPEAVTLFNQTRAICWRLTFLTGSKQVRPEDLTLLVIGIGDGQTLERTLDIDPLAFTAGEAATLN